MISALDELKSVVRCIEAGRRTTCRSPLTSTLLRARVGACLEKKRFRDQEQAYPPADRRTRKRLQAELHEARRYVSSTPFPSPSTNRSGFAGRRTIPRPNSAAIPSAITGSTTITSRSICSMSAATVSAQHCSRWRAINVMRTMSLQNVDFREPAEVLRGLNDTFPMEKHNNMYFTIWYGVYQKSTSRLRHVSGGHPPAGLSDTGGERASPAAFARMLIRRDAGKRISTARIRWCLRVPVSASFAMALYEFAGRRRRCWILRRNSFPS